MNIIQELPSSTGYFRTNVIEGVREVWADKGILPNTEVKQDIIFCELPFGKKYAIGHFPSTEKRDACLNYIAENSNRTVLNLPLEKFFMENYLSKELIEFVLDNYSLTKYLMNLMNVTFKHKMVGEVADMDAFCNFNATDIIAMKKGKYVYAGYEGLANLWCKTLPMSNQLNIYGLNKKEYFKELIKKNEAINYNVGNHRIAIGLRT